MSLLTSIFISILFQNSFSSKYSSYQKTINISLGKEDGDFFKTTVEGNHNREELVNLRIFITLIALYLTH